MRLACRGRSVIPISANYSYIHPPGNLYLLASTLHLAFSPALKRLAAAKDNEIGQWLSRDSNDCRDLT